MARILTVILGLIIAILGGYTLIMYAFLVPDYTVLTSGGTFSIKSFFGTDLYVSIALVVVGIAFIYEGIKAKD